MPGNIDPSSAVLETPTLIVQLYTAVRAVRINRIQLESLAQQCSNLLSTVSDHQPQLIGSPASSRVDEVETIIRGILDRVSTWARYSDTTTFFRQNEIKMGILECYRELSSCSDRFIASLSMLSSSESRLREEARRRDHEQLMDILANLKQELRRGVPPIAMELPPQVEELVRPGEQPGIATGVQQSISQTLPSPSLRPSDLAGRVSRNGERVVTAGSSQDYYCGEWVTDGDPVLLGCPKDQSSSAQQRFQEKIVTWRGLRHRTVLGFFGYVRINDIVYSVSPWMNNGNVREYLEVRPDADRLRLLNDVAEGLEFLHNNDIVHGDLCGRNVLINGEGKACICEYDMFKPNTAPDIFHARWMAPERIESSTIIPPTKEADLWSFGMLCLEVFTGKDPYCTYGDYYVPILLSRGILPEKPQSTDFGHPEMWGLIVKLCWEPDPTRRRLISMSQVQQEIQRMLPQRPTIAQVNPSPPPLALVTQSFAVVNGPIEGADSENTPQQNALVFPPATGPTPPSRPRPTQVRRSLPEPIRLPGSAESPVRARHNQASTSASPRLPTLTEGHQAPANFIPPRHAPTSTVSSTFPKETAPPRSFTAPLPPTRSSSHLNTIQRQNSVASSSSQTTTSSDTGSTRPERRPSVLRWFSRRRAPASEQAPNDAAPRRSQPRSNSLGDFPLPTRQWLPAIPEILESMEAVASDSECLLRPARDGSVSAGNLEGLVRRAIRGTANQSRDARFLETFLIIYPLFATNERVFGILKRRFDVIGAGFENDGDFRDRQSVLEIIVEWLKKGFGDENLVCSSMIREFALSIQGDQYSQTMEGTARHIVSLLDDPNCVRLRKPVASVDLRQESIRGPLRMTPSDLASALTAVEGERYRKIMHWDYVNFSRGEPSTRHIEEYISVHDLVKAWVEERVLTPEDFKERAGEFELWIQIAQLCYGMNNLSTMSAIVTALLSPTIACLVLTCEKKAAREALRALAGAILPTESAYKNTLLQLTTENAIPWLDAHLATLNSTFVNSDLIVEADGHPLIDFKKCSELAEQIESVLQFQPPRATSSIRPEVLAYVEYKLKPCSTLRATIEERSARLSAEEQRLKDHRESMRSIGMRV